MLHHKAGPFGPKGRRVVDDMASLAREWVRHDGGEPEHLPVLFAAALTQALVNCDKLDGATAHKLSIETTANDDG